MVVLDSCLFMIESENMKKAILYILSAHNLLHVHVFTNYVHVCICQIRGVFCYLLFFLGVSTQSASLV